VMLLNYRRHKIDEVHRCLVLFTALIGVK
jgi:hypothetical protein